MKHKMDSEALTRAKQALIDDLAQGNLSLGEAVRRMRAITGKSQKAFARDIVGVSAPVLGKIERDEANPTVETLNRIVRPFGYKVGFVRL